ncbi:MAG: hypothetical protein M3Z92_14040 [Bacteroidota bacterium]|nr:hypothetical protein [Bacteroidota bacterium]
MLHRSQMVIWELTSIKDRWTDWDVWSHKYNIIGLLTYYKATGYEPALEACKKTGNLLINTFQNGNKDMC